MGKGEYSAEEGVRKRRPKSFPPRLVSAVFSQHNLRTAASYAEPDDGRQERRIGEVATEPSDKASVEPNEPTTTLNDYIVVEPDHPGYNRIRAFPEGTTIYAQPCTMDPSEITLVADPNIELGRVRHPRSQEIGLQMILGSTYTGQIVAIKQVDHSYHILFQIHRVGN